MSTSLGVAAVGALAALVFTGLLARRCFRVPTMATVALLCAAASLTVALGAQVGGYHRGFDPTTFRAVELGAQLIAPMALCWALAEYTGKSLGARFASRLALGAVTVIGAVVLATDPLSNAGFNNSWPAASVHYQIIPNAVLKFIAVITALVAVIAVIVTAVRARGSEGWRTLLLAVAAVAVAVLALDGLRVKLPANSAYAVICLAAAALAWFAAGRASVVRLEMLRSGGFAWDEDTGSFIRYHDDDTGDFDYGSDTGGYRRYPGETDGRGWYSDDTGGFRRDATDTDLRGWFRPGAEGGPARREPADTGYGYGVTGAGQGPVTGAHSPVTGAHEPVTGAHEPVTGAHGPVTGAHGPVTGTQGPFTGAQLPVTGAPYGEVAPGLAHDQDPRDRSGYGVVPPDLPPRGQNGTANGGFVETGDVLPVMADYHPVPEPPAGEDNSRLYGQIAIYTLLDEAADEFERLASEVVEQVRSREPDTLVYVMHEVPAAPMQRILYAVYRDEAAFDRHERQPYIRQFEEEREPYVLATNVIELGVRHAKFVPPAGPRPPRGRRVRPRGSSSGVR
jgi:quinol monooxygenase YgiN